MSNFKSCLGNNTIQVVGENLDWFLKRVLKELYGRRRQTIQGADQDAQLIPAIDYIIKTCVDESVLYPPESIIEWHEYFLKLGSGDSQAFQQLLIMYLQLDIANYLTTRERESKTSRHSKKDRSELNILEETLNNLKFLIKKADFPLPLIKLSTGLWAMDNDQLNLMTHLLSDPNVHLTNYFESPKEVIRLIVGTLRQCGHARMALYMSRVHRYENWDETYDQVYSYLLLTSGQIVEALKYERSFADGDNYHDILQNFFELCLKLDVIKTLNRLHLSEIEEEVLNQYLSCHNSANSSRAVTPSTSQHVIKRVTISEAGTPAHYRTKSSTSRTPRNRTVQQLKKMPSFSDSPARNTRSARKKKVY